MSADGAPRGDPQGGVAATGHSPRDDGGPDDTKFGDAKLGDAKPGDADIVDADIDDTTIDGAWDPIEELADESIGDYDRPMRDAPGPRRWAPAALMATGACGVAWALMSAYSGPPAPARLAAPVTEIEYTTGVDDVPPPPRTPPPASGVAPAAAAATRSEGSAPDTTSRGVDAGREALRLADARRHAPVLLASPGGGERAAAPAGRARAGGEDADAASSIDGAVVATSRARGDVGLTAQRARTRADVTLREGAFITATLETAIQSDLPGSIRAVAARDVYSADATRVLIPRGSRLVGSYRSGLVGGRSRVFAVWTRIVRPDGVSIALEAPLTDGAGRAGAGGRRDTHFLERFGASVLLSLIDGAVIAAADDARGDDRIVLATGGDFSRAADIALEHSIDISPTVHVAPGARVQVFVNRDIDFSAVVAASPGDIAPAAYITDGAPR